MYILYILSSLFAASAFAEVSEIWADGTTFGQMLARGEMLSKRQGYVPTQQSCGRGQTCQDACGASYVQCPSTDSRIHCHNPLTGTHCCTDGTGNACKANFYCTTDGASHTYCCPDGINNAECARLYSLTISLYRPSSMPAIPSLSVPSVPAVPVTSLIHITSTHKTATPSVPLSSKVAETSKKVVASSDVTGRNSTSFVVPTAGVTKTSTQLPAFTGGAGKVVGAGWGVAMLVEAVGLFV